jgi:predicted O-methyltransferase YrrM
VPGPGDRHSGGYSTICLARALPQDGRVYTIEIEEKYADIAQNNFLKADLGDKIQILRGEALEVLRQLEEEGIEPFDFVFLDAHKPSYVEYFDWAVEHTAPGALIVADNVIRDGAVLSPETTDEKAQGVIAYNDMLARRSDVQTILVPNISGNGYDGMALSVKR